jgi:molecular chaperone DnaJ
MVKRDYYIILGVSRSESPAGIHEAFRKLAKIYHPDSAGPESTETFQEIARAYATLSHAEQRRAYDETLRRQEPVRRKEFDFPVQPLRAEPLVPEPISIYDFQTIRPSFGALFDRMERNFTGIDVPKGERIEDLDVEVILSPDEAARGVVAPIGLPVFQRCSLCSGSGRDWLFSCVACGGEGRVEREATVTVQIPPMVSDRSIIEIPLRGLGIHNFYLRLHIRISSW